jgi:hypothetical protein
MVTVVVTQQQIPHFWLSVSGPILASAVGVNQLWLSIEMSTSIAIIKVIVRVIITTVTI